MSTPNSILAVNLSRLLNWHLELLPIELNLFICHLFMHHKEMVQNFQLQNEDYIFDHRDKHGLSVIIREVLELAGIDSLNHEDYMVEKEHSRFQITDTVLQRYAHDVIFKTWVLKD